VGDLDSNGSKDLVTADSISNSLSVLIGDGLGNLGDHFVAPFLEQSDTGPGPVDLISADFNNDTSQDLIVRIVDDYYDDTWEFLGAGDGTFIPFGYFTFPDRPKAFATADFNRDGNMDLAVSFVAMPGLVYLGGGNGYFQAAPPSPLHTGARWILTGDFNGDDIPDLALPCDGCYMDNGEHLVSIFQGKGDGSFDYALPATLSEIPVSVAAADFNGDGKLDLAVTTEETAGVSVLLGNGDFTFSGQWRSLLSEVPADVAPGDFNNDGFPDLALALQGAGTIALLVNDGAAGFTSATFDAGSSPETVRLGDLNADSNLDVVTLDRDSNLITILPGVGNGTLDPLQHYLGGVEPRNLLTGDFNGDGRLDLALANFASQDISMLLNQGPFPVCHDEDLDGYGNPGSSICPQGGLLDCDDSRAAVFPGAAELCDGLDNNCDGRADKGFSDADGDSAADCIDDCGLVWNPAQLDSDGDRIGDACEDIALFGDANLSTSGFSSSRVDGRDLAVFAAAFGACPGDVSFNSAANLDHVPESVGPPPACVGATDFHLFMEQFAKVH